MSDLRLRKPAWEEVAFQGVPIFRAHAWALLDAHINGRRFEVLSGDRRRGVAERFGHMSQGALFDCFEDKQRTGVCPEHCHGNCLPANEPGFSSHELRSDGNGVYGPRGHAIPKYKLGIDAVDAGKANDCAELVATLRHLGYHAVRPYSTASEAHHMSFTTNFADHAKRRLTRYAARHPIKWRRLLKQF